MFKLRIKRASLMYDLVFNHRVNTLCGDSGTGKTYLIESIREVVKGVYTKDYFITSCFGENSYIETDLPLVIPSGLKQMRDLTNELNEGSILFIIDEDFIGLSSFKLADFVNTHLNINVVIISRELDDSHLLYSPDSVYKLEYCVLEGLKFNKNVNYLN